MNKKGFTLLELLIVIGILATLTTVAVLVVNPVELLRESRDGKRAVEMQTTSLALATAKSANMVMGASSTVYVSIPDASPICANSGLPALPTGWTYSCKTSANYLKTDGTGWIPINLASAGYVQGALPIDPVNTQNAYYTYVTGNGKWELSAIFESGKYKIGGAMDKVSTDGGADPYRYELGSDLALFKREMLANANFGTGDLTGWTNWAGGTTGVVASPAHFGQKSVIIQNSNSYCNNYYVQDIPVVPNTVYSMGAWIKTSAEVGSSYVGITDTSWGGLGAGWNGSPVVTGTKDWTYVSVQANSGALSTLRFFMTVGWCGGASPGNGPSGTTYFSTPSVVAGTNLVNK